MMRSMYAGVSGLGVHQEKMDIVGNNISNVNTTGFKGSSASFKEMLSQTLQGAQAPQGDRGGINPQQIGLGVDLGSIKSNMEQGNMQSTGQNTDLAIEGSGFFVVNDGDRNQYTRAGSLALDEDGSLVHSNNGYKVQGWMADQNGKINTNDNIESIEVPVDRSIPGEATGEVSFSGNLDAREDDNESRTATLDIFNSQGDSHSMEMVFEKTGENDWEWEVTNISNGDISGNGTLEFDGSGRITTPDPDDPDNFPEVTFEPDSGADNQDITIDFSNLTQSAANYSIEGTAEDGYEMGTLESFDIDGNGVLNGAFSNGLNQKLAQVAVANFSNSSGLKREGGTMFSVSQNSGSARIGEAGTGGRGNINAGSLEMSNIDLSKQFTEMITTQRGFQANSRSISTTDEMLQELVNLKR